MYQPWAGPVSGSLNEKPTAQKPCRGYQLGITENEWKLNMEYSAAALDKFHVPAKEKAEFLALFEQYKTDIVE